MTCESPSPRPAPCRCTRTTAAGRACKAWAVPGSDPPTCYAHGERHALLGAPPGNQNARKHGFYSRTLSKEELADLITYAVDPSLNEEIACARVALRRILKVITDQEALDLHHDEHCRYIALALQATRTIARLLRDRRALSGDSADSIAGAIAQALDELGTEWCVDL
jgi:hypothetical protein